MLGTARLLALLVWSTRLMSSESQITMGNITGNGTWDDAYLKCHRNQMPLPTPRDADFRDLDGWLLRDGSRTWVGGRYTHSDWRTEGGCDVLRAEGCADVSQLPTPSTTVTATAPFHCLTACFSPFVAVREKDCYCLTSQPVTLVDQSNCSLRCATMFDKSCGSSFRYASVYSMIPTSVPWTSDNSWLRENCAYLHLPRMARPSPSALTIRSGLCDPSKGDQYRMYLCEKCSGGADDCNVTRHRDHVTWRQARDKCREQGGQLLWLNRNQSLPLLLHPYLSEEYWIGLRRDLTLHWLNGSEVLADSSQPSVKWVNGTCLAASRGRNGDVILESLDCSTELPFVCDYESQGKTTSTQPETHPSPMCESPPPSPSPHPSSSLPSPLATLPPVYPYFVTSPSTRSQITAISNDVNTSDAIPEMTSVSVTAYAPKTSEASVTVDNAGLYSSEAIGNPTASFTSPEKEGGETEKVVTTATTIMSKLTSSSSAANTAISTSSTTAATTTNTTTTTTTTSVGEVVTRILFPEDTSSNALPCERCYSSLGSTGGLGVVSSTSAYSELRTHSTDQTANTTTSRPNNGNPDDHITTPTTPNGQTTPLSTPGGQITHHGVSERTTGGPSTPQGTAGGETSASPTETNQVSLHTSRGGTNLPTTRVAVGVTSSHTHSLQSLHGQSSTASWQNLQPAVTSPTNDNSSTTWKSFRSSPGLPGLDPPTERPPGQRQTSDVMSVTDEGASAGPTVKGSTAEQTTETGPGLNSSHVTSHVTSPFPLTTETYPTEDEDDLTPLFIVLGSLAALLVVIAVVAVVVIKFASARRHVQLENLETDPDVIHRPADTIRTRSLNSMRDEHTIEIDPTFRFVEHEQ